MSGELAVRPPCALEAGVRVVFDFVVTAGDMVAFERVSGDRNAIHVDGQYARSRGFEGVVVYGGLLLSKVSRLVGMELPTTDCMWNGVRLDFRKPLYVDEPARVEAEVSQVAEAVRAATIKLKIIANDRVLATGTVDVTYFDV